MNRKKASSYSRDENTGEVSVLPRQKLLERQVATASKARALSEVHQKLAFAKELFDHHGDGGRSGVKQAVLDVVDYFSSLGIPMATLGPLLAVFDAIADADRGIESPIFKPNRKAGRPPTPTPRLEFDAVLIAITECCLMHCQAKGERSYAKSGLLLAVKTINGSGKGVKVTATQLRELREKVQQGPRDGLVRALSEELLKGEAVRRAPLQVALELAKHDWVSSPPKVSA